MIEAGKQRLRNGNGEHGTSNITKNGEFPTSTLNQHAAQWERQSEWLDRTRAYKEKLLARGVQGWDLLEAMTTLNLDHKIEVSNHKCGGCWHDRTYHCICSQLPPLELSLGTMIEPCPHSDCFANLSTIEVPIRIKIIVLMHTKEYLSAGNSAKLLLKMLPKQTELFLFGKLDEADRLFHEMSIDVDHTMILWPGNDALSVAEFLDRSCAIDCRETRFQTMEAPEQSPPPPPLVRAVLLDGTYTQARNMLASFRKRFGVNNLPVTVQLRPDAVSVFHRAQKNYGKAHQQTQPPSQHQGRPQTQQNTCTNGPPAREIAEKQSTRGVTQRICTAEACGLLLTELGAPPDVQERIVQAVKINNAALGYGTRGTRENNRVQCS